uniref:Uncharacterized protein n=1 Tax=Trichuris muris TaxID=70415 RepID=A0A5S6QP41_TRIMR
MVGSVFPNGGDFDAPGGDGRPGGDEGGDRRLRREALQPSVHRPLDLDSSAEGTLDKTSLLHNITQRRSSKDYCREKPIRRLTPICLVVSDRPEPPLCSLSRDSDVKSYLPCPQKALRK